ncbi:MAG: outer membrane protein transport protein [Kiritimatiellales bacterium]|nr:outer membrane protein transport protein [Kiritimatiellota bacterium]MBL7011823.1 outer membrane protein transport protein [Kiritimatiellales bacterium]
MILNKKDITVIITSLLSIIVQPSFADGYRNPPEGAAAIGAFGGHRAFADDANATIHNSANLVDLDQPMLQINTTFGYGETEFHGAAGNDRTENPYFAIPGFSIAAPLKEGKYAIGFSTYVPYGRSVQWGSSSPFAQNYLPYEGSMTVMDFTPNVAVRLSDSVSIGIGADIYYGKVEQKQFLGPGMHSKLTGDGTAIGWDAAITWKMTEKQRLAATYRSPFVIKYKGDNVITGLGTSHVDAKIEYPTIVALAYGMEFTDTLRAEINAEWIEFSVYKNLTINDSILGPVSSAQKLKDTWTIGIGGEWDFAEHWTARSGFMYLQNPTPDETYGTLGPDEDQGVISFGLGYENENHTVDIGYAYGLFDGRSISGQEMPPAGNGANGHYDYNVHLLTLSYGYKF